MAKALITWTKHISAPGEVDRATLDVILKEVAEELSAHRAM
ncbi:MAG: hypothetical protein Q8O76_01330 [Chloroflexota bacterium]|nr:hypothetical protein [Chloroflexota bacterium]